MNPHKHAELIKAWADGAEIEYLHIGKEGWQPIFKGWSWDSDFAIQYRIKPESKALSDEEIMQLYEEFIETQYASESNVIGFARAIEEKLGVQYRIKPEPKTNVLKICEFWYDKMLNEIQVIEKTDAPNLKLYFDGETGELKSAEVLR